LKTKLTIKNTFILISLIAMTLFLGCSDNGSSGVTSATVQGQAYFNGPIEGATVRILDLNGEVMASEDGATDTDGNFSIFVWYLPQSFLIEVEGGAVNKIEYAETENSLGQAPEIASVTQEPFSEKVDRYIESFDPNIKYSVNILSSILVDFLVLEPDPDKAEMYFKEYLTLPGYVSVDFAIQTSNYYSEYFNADYFLEDMIDEYGYTDYEQFMVFVVENIQWFAEDWDADQLEGSSGFAAVSSTPRWQCTIRRMSTKLRNSQLTINKIWKSQQSIIRQQQIFDGVDIVFNVIAFGLNALAKATADTQFGRVLGTVLQYLFEGGPDPTMEAIFKNFEAIHESLYEINRKIDGLTTFIEQNLKEIIALINELPLNDAVNGIDAFETKFKTFVAYKSNAGHLTEPEKTDVSRWCNSVLDPNNIQKYLTTIHNTIVGNTQQGKSIFQAWYEKVQSLTFQDPNGSYREAIYTKIRMNFVRLIMAQSQGTMFIIEAYEQEKNPVMARQYITNLLTNLKEQTEKYEEWMEKLALELEWRLYHDAHDTNKPPKDLCPDFPLGNSEKGFLDDVDRFVQKYVHYRIETYTEGGTEKERLAPQDMLTLRIVTPYNEGNERGGLVGVKSSRHWKAYEEYMKGMPSGIPTAPPGQDTVNAQFQFVNVTLYSTSTSTELLTATPPQQAPDPIEGRSPLEFHTLNFNERETWKYTLYKFRRVFSLTGGLPDPTRTFPVELQTRLQWEGGKGSCWHPNLMRGQWPDANGKWNKTLDPIRLRPGRVTYCESYGLYGLKTPQKVRLMAYHASDKPGDDWWYSGWRSQDRGWLFANRQDAYTFYQLWPLGNGYYALRDSLGISWKDGAREWPVYYTKREHRSDPVHRWIAVNPGREWFGHKNLIFADQTYITPLCAYKIEYKKTEARRYYTEYNKKGYVILSRIQPSTKLYTMKTWAADHKGLYLKWHWESGQWDRYHADGSNSDAGNNKDCWISIMPEYDAMVSYLLTATK